MSFDELFNQIKNGKYEKISNDVFDTLENEGWMEEIDITDRNCFESLALKIAPKDASGLKKFDDNAVEKFNLFDIKLKDTFGFKKYIDFIDYEKGTVRIVRVKKECLSKE